MNCGGVVPAARAAWHPLMGLPPLPGMYAFTTPPYFLQAPSAMRPPNPDNPSAIPWHSNIMRHWANMTPDNPVQVIIACNVASNAAGASIFPAATGVTYSWQTWVNDIIATFARFTGCRHADISVNTTAAFTNTSNPGGYSVTAAYAAYDPPLTPPYAQLAVPAPLVPTPQMGQLIWDYSTTAPTPTQPDKNGPTGNTFNEILFLQRRSLLNGGFCSMDVDPATGAIIECDVAFDVYSFSPPMALMGLPSNSSAYRHEIGHFFGLDHTNLQPMVPSFAGAPSWIGFASPTNPQAYSAMTGAITQFGTWALGAPLHWDDQTGLARIYPVQIPDSATGKDPLINWTATIRGHLLDPAGKPRFGDNVFPLARPTWNAPAGGPPSANPPPVGTVSGTARLTPGEVVGAVNTGTGKTCSGSFEILGVPALDMDSGMPATYGTVYDVVAEDAVFSLGTGTAPSYGEWYQENFLNPSINAIAPVGNQTRFYADDVAGAPLLPSAWVSNSVVSSLSVVRGTIIDVRLKHWGGAAATTVHMDSRPLLSISPRTRPPAGGFVTLTSISNYPLNAGTLSLTVNGIPFNLTSPLVTTTTVAPRVTVAIPESALLTAGVPARLVFTAREVVPAGAAGVSFAVGRNEVQY